MVKRALYLAGGGARGAYQAGVLKAIDHILQVKTLPFDIVTGVSVGSINAAALVHHADDFSAGIEKLETLWGEIHCQKIFKATNYELGKSVMRNLTTFLVKQRESGYLMNTEPLRELIDEAIDFGKIKENIQNGFLDAFEVLTNCYEMHQTVSFYDHVAPEFDDWNYPRHISQRADINAEHILSSSSLPLFFPPININGLHYGDGSIGLIAPLRGAIRFKVDKILILGTRELPECKMPEPSDHGKIAFAHILGNMMEGLFMDNLDTDIEMVNRMNEIATLLSMWKKRRSPWRPIQTLHLRPSQDTGVIAQAHFQTMPSLLRYLLNTLGAKNQSGELLSFLLFEKDFARELLDLGYRDTMEVEKAVLAFFA